MGALHLPAAAPAMNGAGHRTACGSGKNFSAMCTRALLCKPAQICVIQHATARRRETIAEAKTDTESSAGASGASGADGEKVAQPLAALLLEDGAPNWLPFLGALFVAGATVGTLLDGIHSRVNLQIYDLYPLELGPLHSSWVVPPLLGLFYVVLGTLTPLSDNWAIASTAWQREEEEAAARLGGSTGGAASAAGQPLDAGAGAPAAMSERSKAARTVRMTTLLARDRALDIGFVGIGAITLALNLDLSAWMFSAGLDFRVICYVLLATSLISWRACDGTAQGIGLALLCALGAPAAEIVLLHAVPLWHYPRADLLLFGSRFVSWVPFCYAFYTPALSNLARYLWKACR